jgi:hypothetical protein
MLGVVTGDVRGYIGPTRCDDDAINFGVDIPTLTTRINRNSAGTNHLFRRAKKTWPRGMKEAGSGRVGTRLSLLGTAARI